MLRETLENLCRSLFGREIRAHCVDHGDPRGSEHFKTKPRVSWRDEIDFAVSEGLEGMEVAQRRSSHPQACNAVGTVVVSCVAVLVLTSCGILSTWYRLCVLRPPVPKCKGRLHNAHTGSMLPTTLWESPRSKLQKVSSEDRRTPVLGQAVNQSAELWSALEFFATAHSFRERSVESVK